MFTNLSRMLLCALAIAALGGGIVAQQGTGRVMGTILDPNGNVITGYTGAVMTLTSPGQPELRTDVSLQGRFDLASVPPGTYTLRVQLGGAMYQSYTQQGVVIAAGQTLDLKIPILWGINLGTFGDDPTMLAKDMARGGANMTGPPPRTAEGTVDISGVWVVDNSGGQPVGQPPLQPWAQDMLRRLNEVRGPDAQNPGAYCLPQSAVLSMAGFPYKFIQAKDVIVQIVEFATPGIRQIFMDGRAHPKPEDWNPSWHGHSVGRWEGDTLVIDNVGFNDVTPGFGIHSEKLHVVERISRPRFNRLEVEITAEDPDAFTGPWKTTRNFALAPDHEILEFVCPENNKDAITFGGLGWKGRP